MRECFPINLAPEMPEISEISQFQVGNFEENYVKMSIYHVCWRLNVRAQTKPARSSNLPTYWKEGINRQKPKFQFFGQNLFLNKIVLHGLWS